VLPDEASLRIQPKDATAGTILFEGWRLAGARVLTPEVQTKTETEGGTLSLSLGLCNTSRVAPPEIDIELTWPRNPVAARLRLAYPAQGARAFDGMGNPLTPDDWIAAHRLAGVRIIAVGSLAKPEIRFGLRHTQSGQYGNDLSYPLRSDLNSQRLEIRLQDYADPIARLLGADELLDAWVLVSIHANYREMLRLRVSRYVAPLERDALVVRLPDQALRNLGTDQLRELPVLALRLDAPADEAVSLSPVLSEGVPTGAWHFDPVVQGPSAWLIYPGQGADILFRPTLWQVGGGDEPRSSLARALAVEHREPRLKALDEVVAEMSADYAEPCWSDLERLAEHLGHLPLPTLDLWRRFAHSAAGMAALAARLHHLLDWFVARFAVELPFSWLGVCLAEWRLAMHRSGKQCQAWLGESDSARKVFKDHLDNRIQALAQRAPFLNHLLNIAKASTLGDPCPELDMMRRPNSDSFFSGLLFDGEQSALQCLLRIHAEEQWPTERKVNELIADARKDSRMVPFLHSGDLGFKLGIVNLPIVLAFHAGTRPTSPLIQDPELVHAVRLYQDFDPDWFTDAFNYTVARCVSRGLIELSE